MRSTLFILTSLSALIVSPGIAQAETTLAPYYNPANSASKTGTTTGKELYKTIGCPGQALFDKSCAEDTPAPIASVPVFLPIPMSAPVAPVAISAPISKPVPIIQAQAKPDDCYSKFAVTASNNFRDAFSTFFKVADVNAEKTR